jgi:hypothetical protein
VMKRQKDDAKSRARGQHVLVLAAFISHLPVLLSQILDASPRLDSLWQPIIR